MTVKFYRTDVKRKGKKSWKDGRGLAFYTANFSWVITLTRTWPKYRCVPLLALQGFLSEGLHKISEGGASNGLFWRVENLLFGCIVGFRVLYQLLGLVSPIYPVNVKANLGFSHEIPFQWSTGKVKQSTAYLRMQNYVMPIIMLSNSRTETPPVQLTASCPQGARKYLTLNLGTKNKFIKIS